MLVINSNRTTNKVLMSNSLMGIYPDVENTIQIAYGANLGFDYTGGTIDTEAYVEDIGGSKINTYTPVFIMPDYYVGNDTNIPVMLARRTNNSYNEITTRVGLTTSFTGGEIVGEDIIFGGYCGTLTSAQPNSNVSYSVKDTTFKLRLLHTDGTFTDIATRSFGDDITVSGTEHSTIINEIKTQGYVATCYVYADSSTPYRPVLRTTTAGVVAAAGDRLVMDISTKVKYSANIWTTIGIFFGYIYSPYDYLRFMPTQVSVR